MDLWNIAYEALHIIFSLLSRILNSIVFGGSMYQTTSARAYIEGVLNPKPNDIWERRMRIINKIVFWEPDHCEKAWRAEVARAQAVIAKNTVAASEAE